MSQISEDMGNNGIEEIQTPPSSPRTRKLNFRSKLQTIIPTISTADCDVLTAQGIDSEEALGIVDLNDIQALTFSSPLVKASIVTWHKYTLTGQPTDGKTIMQIKESLSNPAPPTSTLTPNPTKTEIKAKLLVQEINVFDGSPKNWVK